jgi:hypothetical protein
LASIKDIALIVRRRCRCGGFPALVSAGMGMPALWQSE